MTITVFDLLDNHKNNLSIPERNDDMLAGSVFMAQQPKNSFCPNDQLQCSETEFGKAVAERESNVLNEVLKGNIPNFLKTFCPIDINDGTNKLTYLTMADGICIGNNDDYCRIPITPITGQKICDQFNCVIPTRLMVKQIWQQAINKISPLPWGPPYTSSMLSTTRFIRQNEKINEQLINKNKFALLSGQKKDIIISNTIGPNNPKKMVVIFGWIQLNGIEIQGLNNFSHSQEYLDYSHQLRPVYNKCILNNKIFDIIDILQNNTYSHLLSDEGSLKILKYPI